MLLGICHVWSLVAQCCAILRDYLSNTPLLSAMGFLVAQHGQLGAIPPSTFSEHFPLGEHAKWKCDTTPPPPTEGVSQRYLRDTPLKQNKTRDTPLCDTIPKGCYVIWEGISHWAAKDRESSAEVWQSLAQSKRDGRSSSPTSLRIWA